MVVTEDGHSFAFGWNKHGQLGSGSVKNGMFNYKDCFKQFYDSGQLLFSCLS